MVTVASARKVHCSLVAWPPSPSVTHVPSLVITHASAGEEDTTESRAGGSGGDGGDGGDRGGDGGDGGDGRGSGGGGGSGGGTGGAGAAQMTKPA